MRGGHRLGIAQPGIDLLVGGGEQRLELVQRGFIETGKMILGIGAEDQIDFLEAPALGPEQ